MPSSMISTRAFDKIDNARQYVVSVLNKSTPAVEKNQNRRHLLIINDSDTVIYMSKDVPAVMHFGIRINPGEKIECTNMAGNLCNSSINAIHGKSGAKLLLISEGE